MSQVSIRCRIKFTGFVVAIVRPLWGVGITLLSLWTICSDPKMTAGGALFLLIFPLMAAYQFWWASDVYQRIELREDHLRGLKLWSRKEIVFSMRDLEEVRKLRFVRTFFRAEVPVGYVVYFRTGQRLKLTHKLMKNLDSFAEGVRERLRQLRLDTDSPDLSEAAKSAGERWGEKRSRDTRTAIRPHSDAKITEELPGDPRTKTTHESRIQEPKA